MRNLTFNLFISFALAFAPITVWSVPKEQDRQLFEGVDRNLLKNPGFEAREAEWTATGSSALTMNSGTPAFGKINAVWDASAISERLESSFSVIPEGLKGRNCSVIGQYKWPVGVSNEIKMQVYDGTTVIAESGLDPATGWMALPPLLFTCPATGAIQLRFESQADTPPIELDSLQMGKLPTTLFPTSTVPICTIIASTQTSDFGEYMLADGRTISRSAFPEYLNNCGTVYGSGDGSTTVHLPDLRGRFLRGVDNGAGRDPDAAGRLAMNGGGQTGDAVGSVQSDQNASHSHGSGSLTTNSTGAHTHTFITTGGSVANNNIARAGLDTTVGSETTSSSGAHAHTISGSSASSGGNESRPVNAYVNYFIKVKGGVQAEAVTYETSGEFWDVTIEGSNVDLGVTTDGSYGVPSQTDLVLTKANGSSDAFIPCASGEQASGTTCTNDEQPGIALNVNRAGEYEACIQYSQLLNLGAAVTSPSIVSSFKLALTQNSSETIIQDADAKNTVFLRLNTGSGTNAKTDTIYYCEKFYLNTGLNTIRYFEKTTILGTVNQNEISFLDDTTLRIKIHPTNETMMAPVFTDLKESLAKKVFSNANNIQSHTFAITNDGISCTTNESYTGSLISSVTRNGTGDCSVNWSAGAWNQYLCTVTGVGSTRETNIQTLNASVFRVGTRDSTGALINSTFYAICLGSKP